MNKGNREGVMSKKSFVLLTLALVWLLSLSAVKAGGENPRVFTNEDIEKYKGPANIMPPPDARVIKEEKEADRKYKEKELKEEKEMEYWCKRGTVLKRRIEDSKDVVKETEDDILERKTKGTSSRKKSAALEKRLEKAKKRLRDAEGDLRDLEDEAHRKGIKPGWLRCQL